MLEDREFIAYLNICTIYEIMSMCEQFGSEIVLEDGRITKYLINKEENV